MFWAKIIRWPKGQFDRGGPVDNFLRNGQYVCTVLPCHPNKIYLLTYYIYSSIYLFKGSCLLTYLFKESYALNYLSKDHMHSSIFPKDPPYSIFFSNNNLYSFNFSKDRLHPKSFWLWSASLATASSRRSWDPRPLWGRCTMPLR